MGHSFPQISYICICKNECFCYPYTLLPFCNIPYPEKTEFGTGMKSYYLLNLKPFIVKILVKILIALAIIIAIPLIAALFISRDFNASGEIVIQKPRQEVFEYIRFVKNQDNFGVWQLADPEMKTTSAGMDGTPGFVYSWESKVSGNGSQEIIRIIENELVETRLDFGFGEPATGFFELKEAGENQTSVTWGVKGKTPYPWNVFGLFMDMSSDFQEGLANLKTILENQK